MRVIVLGILLALVSPAVRAQLFSGTVTGIVTAADPRTDPYGAAGYADGANGGAARLTNRFEQDPIALRNALVVVCVRLAYAPCTPLWTRTDATGRYTVAWSGMAPPTSIRTRVYPQQPDIAIGAVVASAWPPAATFRVTTAGITDVIIGERTETTNLTGNRTINVLVDPGEPTAAFLTAREVYSMLGSQSIPPGGSILGDMQGVDIFVNDLGVPGGGGVALTDSEVLLVPSTATLNPFTLAHELGHIVAWRSLDVGVPPYEFTAYAACGASGDYPWSDFTLECEKPAFWEGFAHVVGGFWMWNPEVQPAEVGGCGTAGHGIPRGGCTSLESPLQRPGSTGGASACGAGAPGHQRAICNARALWDVVDRPNSLGRDLGEIVRVLRAYPRVCLPAPFDNRCVNEWGYDGMNWKDYKANHVTQFTADSVTLEGAENSNNLMGSSND